MDEVGWEGAPLANSLNGALICLVHQDDSLQECLYVCFGLQPAQRECWDMMHRCRALMYYLPVGHDHGLQETFWGQQFPT